LKGDTLKYLAIFFGLVSVLVSMIYGNTETLYIKPLFHVFIYWFYVNQTKKNNWLLLLFLTAAMVGEMFVALGFEANYTRVMLLFAVVFFCGIILLKPVLNSTRLKFKLSHVLIPMVVAVGLVYTIISIYISAVDYMPQLFFYSISLVLYCVFIFSCFYITLFNKHPKNTYIFIVGVGYILVTVGTFLFEVIQPSRFLLGLANLSEVIAQFYFVIYVINIKDVATKMKWYL